MIAIIDYGMGNLHSVKNALDHLNIDSFITSDPSDLKKADRLILPGVGAFPDCMHSLKEKGLYEAIIEEVNVYKKPILGICLGMQALFEDSDEVEYTKGFGFLKGSIKKMEDPNVKIPHIGWNRLEINHPDPLFDKLSKETFVYYVHSYYACDYDDVDLLAYSNYGDLKICGFVKKNHIVGAQFHPEKSGKDGLAILQWFDKELL